MPKALEGVKIADFTWVAAGPLTTSYLAHHGATVIRVESATRPDNLRSHPPFRDRVPGLNRSVVFAGDNANKLSMTINLKHPKGIYVAKKLVKWADVFAENFVPGTVEKWGLGYEDLKEINPSIIMFRSSSRGQTGPQAKVPALGITLQGLTGHTFLTGWPDRDPVQPWGAYTDVTAPPLGAAMLLAALDYRARTGKGQCLDLSQFEAGIHYLAPAVLDYFAHNRSATRIGNSCSYAAPHGVYRCRGEDRWCAIAVFGDQEWKCFCDAIGKPEWTKDPSFATVVARKDNELELNRLIEEWTVGFTAEEVMTQLQGRGISAGVVENTADLFEEPQIRERGLWWDLDHPEIGRLSHRGPAFKLSKTPAELDRSGPCQGQHTEYVCREVLGISNEEYTELVEEGALT